MQTNHPLILQTQEIPLDDPRSSHKFLPVGIPFLATPGAIEKFGHLQVCHCLAVLREKAEQCGGLDYLQVFKTANGDTLWFIEDGAITALLPEEY